MEAKELLERYKAGQCTNAEKAIVETWYLKFEQEPPAQLSDVQLESALDRIWNRLPLHEEEIDTRPSRRLWLRLAGTAAVLTALATGVYFFNASPPQSDAKRHAQHKAVVKNDILPGGNKATLTLANGKQITLDGAGNGKLAEESGIVITKTKDGQLVYTISEKSGVPQNGQLAMNTISTPKGGQYQINLPDGSKVWLNAASSLRYPAVFTGHSRKVSLTGEAYFEVAKAPASMPFKVQTAHQTVEVLGTHFNINAYTDEPGTKTTLLEGAVKVSLPEIVKATIATEVVLKPGQQSAISGERLNVNFVNTEAAVAWKNGMFRFKDADLQTVMRSVARWYDVEVDYEGNLPARQFSGEIHRNVNLSELLDILSFYKVHFRIDGKKITVTP